MNEQRADAYRLISNVAKALVMAFKDIFNESILGRPQQGWYCNWWQLPPPKLAYCPSYSKPSGGQVQQALTGWYTVSHGKICHGSWYITIIGEILRTATTIPSTARGDKWTYQECKHETDSHWTFPDDSPLCTMGTHIWKWCGCQPSSSRYSIDKINLAPQRSSHSLSTWNCKWQDSAVVNEEPKVSCMEWLTWQQRTGRSTSHLCYYHQQH